ncbi:MAG TPA: AMP-binding protein [Noviherbaspirillum sp.]|uniref:AMP-dependent synthetase/ligase n=1 Tax=Noviherbaspirillum sp. TaxID=1926288 RepID=UPI002B47B341|nr:AMP-binding protein [Noviherbaspirillum sp.]HJV88452.1 AMP-binding protein [Noviherbaspirillum sp.]
MHGQRPIVASPAPHLLPGDTIPCMFWNGVRIRADKILLREKEFGIWKSVTWREAGQVAREIGMGLAALGFAPGDTASILANTVKEWLFADLGVLGAGGVSSGIYPTDAAAQVEYLVNDSSSSFLFVEDDEQLDKALEVRSRMPGVRTIIVFDMEGLRDLDDPQVISLDRLREIGREFDMKHPGFWEERLIARRPEDLAILIYTSGTTGKPKGAMLSHANVIAAVRGYADYMPQGEDDERMAFLPMCHVGERVMGCYFSMLTGTRMNFVENPDTVPENVREIAPTIFAAVPRIWEKFYSTVTIKVAEATPLERWAYEKAIAIGTRVSELRLAGRRPSAGLALLHGLARFLVLTNVRKLIGIHRAHYLITGAAPISPELVRWYLALGVEMRELWGQTECSCMTTVMPAGRIKPGTVGRAPDWADVKVSPEGELMIRGPHVFMGYLNQPEKTAETVRDGWLYTGDVGEIDAEGFVKITDRMKDIIITAGGKNITPSEWENQLKFSPYITDAVVIGDRRPYLTCLVMIDHENVEKFAQDNAIPFSSYASLCRSEPVQELIQREIEKVNAKFARVEQIKKFRLIEQKLTAEDEELTPTMKLKRKLVNEKYKELIESMYR